MMNVVRKVSWLSSALATVVCLGAVSGCATGYMAIKVQSEPSTNQRLPLQMVIRAVDPKSFLIESYNDVAPKAITQDESVLDVKTVYPGTPLSTVVKVPKGKAVAAYFLFTAPAEPWRMLFDDPVPALVAMELQGNRIRPDVKKSGALPSGPPKPPAAPTAPAAPAAPAAPKL